MSLHHGSVREEVIQRARKADVAWSSSPLTRPMGLTLANEPFWSSLSVPAFSHGEIAADAGAGRDFKLRRRPS